MHKGSRSGFSRLGDGGSKGRVSALPLPNGRCGTKKQIVKRGCWIFGCLVVLMITLATAASLGTLLLKLVGNSEWLPAVIVGVAPTMKIGRAHV